jgi:hypothetical protein
MSGLRDSFDPVLPYDVVHWGGPNIELGTYMSGVGLGTRFEQRRRQLATASTTNED